MANMSHHRPNPFDSLLSRRQLLTRCGMGMGALALGTLLSDVGYGAGIAGANTNINPLMPKGPQFPGRAKRVIHLFMNGGPSQVDTFDPKPALEKYAGKMLPIANYKFVRKTGVAYPSAFKF